METNSINKNNSEDQLQLVSFRIGQEEFGVNISSVREITKVTKITKIPNAPPYVDGIVNLRGKIIPLIELRTKLDLPKKEHDKDTRIIILENNGKNTGFIVDSVNKVLRIDRSSLEDPSLLETGLGDELITSVAKLEDRIIILLDLTKSVEPPIKPS